MVYVQGSGATAIKVLNARTWTITLDREFDSSNHLGDVWVTQVLGLQKWTGNVEGNLDTTDTTAFDAAVQTSLRNLYLYPDQTQTSRYYYGTVWPKIDVKIAIDATERFTMDFEGDGALSYN